MAKHRIRITLTYKEPITDELVQIWQDTLTDTYEGIVGVEVKDATLTDADEERLRGQAAVARRANVRREAQ